MQTQAVIDHIVQWLKSYAENARMKGFVVGVSGGIDSAVVSILAAQTGLQTLLIEKFNLIFNFSISNLKSKI